MISTEGDLSGAGGSLEGQATPVLTVSKAETPGRKKGAPTGPIG